MSASFTRSPAVENSTPELRKQPERASAFEVAAVAGWEHRRCKWTSPEWDRLPLETRLVIVSKTEAAINAYLAATAEGK